MLYRKEYRFQIAVDDSLRVQKAHALQHARHDAGDVIFGL